MHKLILDLFKFLKSSTQFLKILMVFFMLMLILYWAQNLSHTNWSWLSFITPLLENFLNLGKKFTDNSIQLGAAVFEYKYFAALLIMLVLFYSCNILNFLWDFIQDLYGDGRRFVKQQEEKAFNKSLEETQNQEQEKIKRYNIYVETSIKKRFSYKENQINLEEQNRIMNKFLMEKTGVNPTRSENGFLYSFGNFDKIDSSLEYFFKLLKSDSPLDYIICVQIDSGNRAFDTEKLKELIHLKFVNKIVTMSDTVWRYNYNNIQKYNTSQLGLFQKNENTFEVHQFTEKE